MIGVFRQARFKELLRPAQFRFQRFGLWQSEAVFRRHNLVSQVIESIVGDSRIFLRAEDKADRRIFIGQCQMLRRIVDIQIHLPGVRVSKLADLQVNDDKTTQATMIEEQIYSIPLIPDRDSLLARDEGEIIA
jgi:hypothetical protein